MLKQTIDFEDLETLPLCGFVDHMRVVDLQDSCDSVPTCKGIYLVARDDLHSVLFLEKSTGHFKGKDPSIPISKLVSIGLMVQKSSMLARLEVVGAVERYDAGYASRELQPWSALRPLGWSPSLATRQFEEFARVLASNAGKGTEGNENRDPRRI